MDKRKKYIIAGGAITLVFLCVGYFFFTQDFMPSDETFDKDDLHSSFKPEASLVDQSKPHSISAKSGVRIKQDPLLEESSEPLYSTSVHAEVKFGQTLVLGGWLDDEDSYNFIFATPEPVDGGQVQNVVFSTKHISVHSGSIESLKELKSLLTAEKHTDQNGETWETGDLPEFMRKLAQTKATDILTAPRITTRHGQQGQIEIEGYSLSLEADLLEDGSGYDMKLGASLSETSGE